MLFLVENAQARRQPLRVEKTRVSDDWRDSAHARADGRRALVRAAAAAATTTTASTGTRAGIPRCGGRRKSRPPSLCCTSLHSTPALDRGQAAHHHFAYRAHSYAGRRIPSCSFWFFPSERISVYNSEAELVHLRAELVEAVARRGSLEEELHALLLRLHAIQLQRLPGAAPLDADAERIRRRLEEELQRSPSRQQRSNKDGSLQLGLAEVATLQSEAVQLRRENTALRNTLLALHSELYGAKLAAKYLDKELAGRIQQLQLLGREMRGEIRDKLWRQLEAEILLHRHKTVVRACRSRNAGSGSSGPPLNTSQSHSQPQQHQPSLPQQQEQNQHQQQHQQQEQQEQQQSSASEKAAAEVASTSCGSQGIGEPRTVTVRREPGEGLGISITGGREHGVPILISELDPDGPAARCGNLYVGDAVLCVNSIDLRQACHQEAVEILSAQTGDITLEVQYVSTEDSDEDNSLGEDLYGFRYRFFDDEVLDGSDPVTLHPLQNGYISYKNNTDCALITTPTAPRTPESPNEQNRNYSDCSIPGSPLMNEKEQLEPHSAGDPEAGFAEQLSSSFAVSCSTNSPSHSDTNFSAVNMDPSPYSPMQVSTDGRSSVSEDSLVRSPIKDHTGQNYYKDSDTSISVPSTPNNNNNRQSVTNEDDKYNLMNIGVTTLQHIFGNTFPNPSASPDTKNHISSDAVDGVSLGSVILDSNKNSLENTATTGAKHDDVQRHSAKIKKTSSIDSTSDQSPGETSSLISEKCRSKSRESQKTRGHKKRSAGTSVVETHGQRTGRSSTGVTKFADTGHRSGRAQRLAQDISPPSVSGSSRSVGTDSFGDPDFGTPV
ncbi:uncharacterized protein LOC124712248 [Schistocerca piceifrons]|uniref:uncharacterized protein LOC124712248 n=1 Tax=Schistocerca piceifrons TaxID=274613 RepID=UPI001F5FE5F0|nr:uncharacterized protein LOC124712248 [Schistocerca piceifrons]